MSEMHDPYDDQLMAARYRAERDQSRQECERLRRKAECLEDDIENLKLELGEAKGRLRDSVPREAYESRRATWLRHIRECEEALHRRREYIKKLENAALERRTVRAEDREAAEWVRGHGGLDAVETRWDNDTQLADAVIYALWPYGMPDGGGNEDVMDELSKRLMPKGYEWPRYEDGEPVRFLDDFERYGDENSVSVVTMYSDGSFALNFRAYSKGERVNRPAHEMVDVNADAVRVGDKVYDVDTGDGPYEVYEISNGVAYLRGNDTPCYLPPNRITHRAPVLAADGKPLHGGETVWDTKGNGPYIIDAIEGDGVVRIKGNDLDYFGADFTHQRPDSWEKLCEDAAMFPGEYINCRMGGITDNTYEHRYEQKISDLVRRAKALAGVSE